MDWYDPKFWIPVGAASLFAALLSKAPTWWERLLAVGVGILCAVVLTGPVVHWMALDAEVYEQAVAAVLAISGDRIVRRLFDLIERGELPWSK